MHRGGYDGIATYEHGDAVEIVGDCDGPFDVVLIDNEKDRYREAFEAVRGKVAPGGLVLADNAVAAGVLEFEDLLAFAEGDPPDDPNEYTRGVWEYLERVRGDPAFETGLLPLGEGVAVSRRLRREEL